MTRLLLAVLLASRVGVAQELLTPGEQVLRELPRALAAKDEGATLLLLAEVGELYRFPASPTEAQALLKAAGAATRAESESVRIAALRALGSTGAAAAVSFVEPLLRSAKPAAGEERVVLAAVQAAGHLRALALLPPLLKLAGKTTDATLAGESFGALAEYCGADVQLRKLVATRVLGMCLSLERRRMRWRRLAAPGLRALQRLMGRRLNTVVQFADWWRVAKTRKDPFRK